MVDIIIIAVVFVLLLFALRSSVRHFKGEKTCCSGGSRGTAQSAAISSEYDRLRFSTPKRTMQ